MKLATWNVNSIRSRETHVAAWLQRQQPDALLLQEIKCETTAFPAARFKELGYHAVIVGQKSYNGVAILTRHPTTTRRTALPGLPPDTPARYVEIALPNLVLGNLYLPNGNSGGETGYQAKLDWMAALVAHARDMLATETDFVLAGDYNVCPTDEDYASGALGASDALIRPQSRGLWRALLWLGLTDAQRQVQPTGRAYTFWDYQAGCWPRDRGLRIDHALLSPRIAERLLDTAPDRQERDAPQPSDHVPLVITLNDS
ncbi:exodeoxyribonuclease III [Lichenicoccus sp.]|uniref:exodeoxyribonuclease III n=1 Tax=Lichenicoccus sp. TaxID=2781899 RepID=UPI003D10C868